MFWPSNALKCRFPAGCTPHAHFAPTAETIWSIASEATEQQGDQSDHTATNANYNMTQIEMSSTFQCRLVLSGLNR
jgi:hypothetical protein